jgi:hypothetical protein
MTSMGATLIGFLVSMGGRIIAFGLFWAIPAAGNDIGTNAAYAIALVLCEFFI